MVVIIPVGPLSPAEDVRDTVESVVAYLPNCPVILADNSRRETAKKAGYGLPLITVLDQPSDSGAWGSLFVRLCGALCHAVDTFPGQHVLRFDDDALMVGAGFAKVVDDVLSNGSNTAILGSYRTDCKGKPRDFAPAVRGIRRETDMTGITHWKRWRLLRGWLAEARSNGYEDGEHALGAACVMSAAFLKRIRPLLSSCECLRKSNISEDHLFGMLARMHGFEIGDFATGDRPMAVAWRALPFEPADLAPSKMLIHSVRNRPDVRAHYKLARERGLASAGSTATAAKQAIHA